MYAALEYCVTKTVEDYISHMCATNVRPAHLEYVLGTIALDSKLTAARDAGTKNKWITRRAIFEDLAANEPCAIPDTVFGTFLHNIWPKTLEEIFLCLGVKEPYVSHPSEIGYLREIVEKRNGIAHGRTTAQEAAEGLTISDIQKRLDVVYSVCMHFLDTIEQYAQEKKFIRPRYRRNYA
jgi:hypothetical protein